MSLIKRKYIVIQNTYTINGNNVGIGNIARFVMARNEHEAVGKFIEMTMNELKGQNKLSPYANLCSDIQLFK
jgi:hypothetical protein